MRILTVDDSAVARRAIRNDLRPTGHEVLEATTGEDALELLAREWVDLVILDVHMPGINGYETCRRIRALEAMQERLPRAAVPIVFVTADDTMAGRMEGFEAGAVDFIVKPFAAGRVRLAVESLLQSTPVHIGPVALVVDDSALARRIICQSLGQLGVEVRTAADGEDALARLREDSTGVHLVVTDWVMERMHGDALCRAIRNDATLRHLPVLVLSGLEGEEYRRTILRAGASEFLRKPFVKEVFLSRVAALLRGHAAGPGLQQRLVGLYGHSRYEHTVMQFAAPEDAQQVIELLRQADALTPALTPARPR